MSDYESEEENTIPSIVITKEQIENIIDDDVSNDDWNTFAYGAGCGINHLDPLNNSIVSNLMDQFEDTGTWPVHTLGNLFLWANPSFDELETFLMKYNVVLTDEIWDEYYNSGDPDDSDSESDTSDFT
jgi:hypothetical protein